jgi:hypothetical protein
VSTSRNRGIVESDGEWIAFLDDDDLWSPDKLGMQVARAEATGPDWSYGGSVALLPTLEICGAGPPPSAEAVCRELPLRNIVPGGASNVVVRRSLLSERRPFDTALRHMSDWDMWIRLASAGRRPSSTRRSSRTVCTRGTPRSTRGHCHARCQCSRSAMHICAAEGPWIGRTSTGGSRGAPCAQDDEARPCGVRARYSRRRPRVGGSSDDSSNSARTGHLEDAPRV